MMWIGGMKEEEAEALKAIAINGFLATTRENYKHIIFTEDVVPVEVIGYAERQLALDKVFMELISDIEERLDNLIKEENDD